MERPPVTPLLASGAAIVSGLLLAMCYPRFDQNYLVWLWLFPLLTALWYLPPRKPHRRLWRGFGLGYLAGLAFFGLNLQWIREVSTAGWAVFPVYLALFPACWGAIAATAGRPRDAQLLGESDPPRESHGERTGSLWRGSFHSLRCAFINAAAWAGLEWLRGWIMTGFGWNGVGVALRDNITLIQIADIIGVTGLSFIPIFTACVLMTTVRRFQLEIRHGKIRPHLDFGLTMAMLASLFLYGLSWTFESAEDEESSIPLKTLLVQLNVPQDEKWDPAHAEQILENYALFTEAVTDRQEIDLVVWPESALPQPLFRAPNQTYLDEVLSNGSFYLLLGANDEDFGNQAYYNAAVLLRGSFGNDDFQIYNKVHLVPFGEFLPLREELPIMERMLKDLIPSDFNRGTSTEPLSLEKGESGETVQIIPLICFEDTVGRLARKFVRKAPQLMVNLTNDGWFGKSEASEQHLANARFRCIELRRPMIRACNTGVTCIIDSAGRVLNQLDDPKAGIFVEGYLVDTVQVPKASSLSFYSRHGDLFTALVSCLALCGIVISSWQGCRRRVAL